ncbi:MAG: DMT family transporter [Actinomycetota bacterium]
MRTEVRPLVAQASQRSGLLRAAGAALAFGTLAIFAKFAYEQGARPLPLLGVRFAFATVILVIFNLFTGRSLKLSRARVLRLLALGGLGYGLESTLFFAALERAPASLVGLIFYSYPIWTNIIGLATKLESFRASTLVALLLGTAGVLSIFTIPRIDPTGALLALASAVAVAFYYVLAQIFQRGVEPAVAAAYTAGGAALATSAGALLAGQGIVADALPHALGLAVATAVAFILLYGAIARIGSARSSIAAMLEPVTTLVLAAIFLGELLSARVLIGATLIVATLPVLMTAETRRTGRPAAPADAL